MDICSKCALFAALFTITALQPSSAQNQSSQPDPHAGHQMPPGMNMPGMNQGGATNEPGTYLMTLASGTSMNPRSWPMPALMPRLGSGNFMFMAQGFLMDTQQSGPRGRDKLYSPNWGMIAAQHRLGKGSFMLQSMFSLEPATVTHRSYPLLFQTGETAYGIPLADAQHPHDFFMGLGVTYAHLVGENTMLQFYYAPVGDPALGPVAFPHRASAAELPQATLAHHLQDSTHIAANVATIAIKRKWLRLEASGFHGTEPNENRWNLDWGPMNSYSARLSVFPARNWMAQVSAGRITNPERQAAGDVVRATASLHYTRPLSSSYAWSTSLIWGRNHDTSTGHDLNSYLIETVYPVTKTDFLSGRAELVDKNELFESDSDQHQGQHGTGSTFRVQAYTAGYTRDVGILRHVQSGLGVNVMAYAIPPEIKPFYGDHPWGINIFLRLRLKPGE